LTPINAAPLFAWPPPRTIRADIMKRSLRRLVARIAIAALAFGQLVAVVHACGTGVAIGPDHRAATIAAGAAAKDLCGAHAGAPVAPPANLCTAHCQDGTIPVVTPDLPPMALAPLPVAGPLPELLERSGAEYLAHIRAPGGAPPPTLRYCRILI
jgi:hypothetical protein